MIDLPTRRETLSRVTRLSTTYDRNLPEVRIAEAYATGQLVDRTQVPDEVVVAAREMLIDIFGEGHASRLPNQPDYIADDLVTAMMDAWPTKEPT